jgi:hypothetical protein
MTEAAKNAKRRAMAIARAHNPCNFRSEQESLLIKLYIWQAYLLADGHPPRQKELAKLLGVQQAHVSKVQQRTAEGMAALARHGRVTLDDLRKAQRFRTKTFGLEPENTLL